MSEEETEEILEKGQCKVLIDRDSNIHIECAEPVKKMTLYKNELDMAQGISDDIMPDSD